MIVVTGASGRTGKRVAEILIAKGKKVRVIGRDARRLAPLVDLGAEGAVGSVEDVPGLSTFFEGAEAVYLVMPEDLSQPDLRAHQERISNSYAAAIANAHVPFVVNLSSIGGQHAEGTGPIVGLHNQEEKLNRDISMNEAALIVGKAMGNSNVSYVQLPNEVLTASLLEMGLPAKSIDLIVEMWEGANAGLIRSKEQRSARNTTPTSLESFVGEVFAPAVLAASH